MSYETLTKGNIKFNKDTDFIKRADILTALRAEIEGSVEYNSRWNEWTFEKVNLCSHVKAERIEELIKKYKDNIQFFTCSIFNLESPDERVVLDNGEIISQIIRRPQ